MPTFETIPAGSTRRWIKQQPPQFLPFQESTDTPNIIDGLSSSSARPLSPKEYRRTIIYGYICSCIGWYIRIKVLLSFVGRAICIVALCVACMLHACIIVVDYGSVYGEYIQALLYSFFSFSRSAAI